MSWIYNSEHKNLYLIDSYVNCKIARISRFRKHYITQWNCFRFRFWGFGLCLRVEMRLLRLRCPGCRCCWGSRCTCQSSPAEFKKIGAARCSWHTGANICWSWMIFMFCDPLIPLFHFNFRNKHCKYTSESQFEFTECLASLSCQSSAIPRATWKHPGNLMTGAVCDEAVSQQPTTAPRLCNRCNQLRPGQNNQCNANAVELCTKGYTLAYSGYRSQVELGSECLNLMGLLPERWLRVTRSFLQK